MKVKSEPDGAAAERAHPAEEALRRWGPGEWPGPARPEWEWEARSWSPRPPSGAAEGRIWKLGKCREWSPCAGQKSPDTPGSPEGNTEGPGTASSEPPLPS